MLGAHSRGYRCANMYRNLCDGRFQTGSAMRDPSFVDFYVIPFLSIIKYDTVPIGIICCFVIPLKVSTSHLSTIE